MSRVTYDTDFLSTTALSVALVSPDDDRRRIIARSLAETQVSRLKEVPFYPGVDDLPDLAGDRDVIVVDLDPDPERALELVESTCSNYSSVTVMVYSARSDSELLVRSMRAGAREFLTEPVRPEALMEALVRASVRQDEMRRHKKTMAKLLVFVSAKGGSGVTTVAANFAVALVRESEKKVALVDLDLYLGDAALTLGLAPKFSALDALEQPDRLDSEFVSALLTKHASGVQVLAAPDAIPSVLPSKSGIEKLIRVLREGFDYVVVDAGSNPAEICGALFDTAASVYLVVQAGICELRNANRFVSRYFEHSQNNKLEVVLNRFDPRNLEIDEASVSKALGHQVQWKIPNDFPAARRAQNTGVPIATENTLIARAFGNMAKRAMGHAVLGPEVTSKKKFRLF